MGGAARHPHGARDHRESGYAFVIRAPRFPRPPVCDHPDRPDGKPLCQVCFDAWKPKFQAWRDECERLRGIGHA